MFLNTLVHVTIGTVLVSRDSLGKYSLLIFLEEVDGINNTCFLDIWQRSTVSSPSSEGVFFQTPLPVQFL